MLGILPAAFFTSYIIIFSIVFHLSLFFPIVISIVLCGLVIATCAAFFGLLGLAIAVVTNKTKKNNQTEPASEQLTIEILNNTPQNQPSINHNQKTRQKISPQAKQLEL